MAQFNFFRLFCLFFPLIFTASCAQLFETDADVQARKALKDLIKIQEAFHSENQRYARNLVEIEKYNLKYHNGLVYLEIESAGKNRYRAISLPAESTSARVFAFDTRRGGYYEMDEIETSQYVLGALNHIRVEQSNKRISQYFFFLPLGVLFILGTRFHMRFKGAENRLAFAAFYLSLVPLVWSFSVLNHASRDIVFSDYLSGISAAALVLAVLAIVIDGRWLMRRKLLETPASLISLSIMTAIIALFSGGVMVNTFLTYASASLTLPA